MKTTRLMCGLALGAVLALGCDRSDDTTAPAPAPPTPDMTPRAGGGASDAGGGARTGAGTPDSSTPAPSTTPSEDTAAAPTTRPTGDGSASLQADVKAAEQTKQAQDLIDQAMTAMKDKRFDDARASLDKLRAMGADVPKTFREQAETMRKSLEDLEKAPAEAAAPPPPPDEENK